jgi:glycosyltransferase involved in cell wall biosynthesis
MPRLVLLSEFPTLAGGENSMLSTLPALAANGFEIVVLAPPGGPLEQAVQERGADFVPLITSRAATGVVEGDEPAAGTSAGAGQGGARQRLAVQLRRVRPELLHANSLAMARLAGPVAVELGLRSIGHIRDIVRLSRRAISDVNCHARILAVSAATRDYHIAAGLQPSTAHVLHNGVDLDRFQPRPPSGYLHRELGLNRDARLIATIGQICLRKGHDVFMRAARRLAGRDERLHFLVVGERFSSKAESRQFEESARELADAHMPGRVHWLGTRSDVDRLLNELTLLLHAARQEPLGRVLLEAAASGVPTVATDVGGTREIYPPVDEQGENRRAEQGEFQRSALLVPPDDEASMAEAAWSILCDSALAERMSLATRRRAEEAFDIARASRALIEHYRAVLE